MSHRPRPTARGRCRRGLVTTTSWPGPTPRSPRPAPPGRAGRSGTRRRGGPRAAAAACSASGPRPRSGSAVTGRGSNPPTSSACSCSSPSSSSFARAFMSPSSPKRVRVELARALAADADAEHQPAAAQPVERHRLARQLVRAAARERRDQRAGDHALGAHRDRGHRDPRVGERRDRRRDRRRGPRGRTRPTRAARRARRGRRRCRLGELVEGRDEDGAFHSPHAICGPTRVTPGTAAAPTRAARRPCARSSARSPRA